MKNSGIPLSSFNPKMQAQIIAQLGPPPKFTAKPTNPMIRQNSTGLNKTEQTFKERLESQYPTLRIHSQAITLKLANGLRYTPDFLLETPDRQLWFYEVKGGFMRDDANAKLKVAAHQYPQWRFFLAWKYRGVNGGEWDVRQVLP